MTKLFTKSILPILLLCTSVSQRVSAAGPLTATLTVTNLNCNGSNSGKIVVHASGGTAPYQYSLTEVGNRYYGFQSADSFTRLNPGAHIVDVTDAVGTSVSLNTNITQPSPLVVLDSVINATAGLNNGAIYTIVSGGKPPYTYAWSNGDTTPNITGLAPGALTYSIYVTDASGCQGGVSQITLDTGNSVLRIQVQNISTSGCYPNQTYQLQQLVTGGVGPYQISLDGGATSATNSGTFTLYNMWGNIHTFVVTDSRQHTLTVVDTFATVASAPLKEAIQVTQASGGLNNGSVVVTATGGTPPYVYNISNSTFTGLAPYQYGVVTTDAHGCTASLLAVITDTTLNIPLGASFHVQQIDCGNSGNGYGTITLTGGLRPYYVQLDSNPVTSGITTFYNIATGNHTFHIVDAANTVFTLPIHMPGDSLKIQSTLTNASNNLSNGAIVLNISLGVQPYTINWSDNTNTLTKSGLAYGTSLSVSVTDSLGCSVNADYLIDSGALKTSYVVQQPSACDGGHVIITPSGGIWPYTDGHGNQYSPSYDFNNLYAGTYTFLVIDAVNDTVRVNANITGLPPVPLAISYTTVPAGNGHSNGSIIAHVTGGTAPYHYQWSLNSIDTPMVTSVSAGNYYLRVRDTMGCTHTQYNIIVYDTTGLPLTADIYSNPNSSCDTSLGTAEVDVHGGTGPYRISIGTNYDFPDYNGRIYYYGLHGGVYPITILDAAGDTFRSSITVQSLPVDAPIVVSGTITNPTNNMANGAVMVHVSGGVPPYSYYWDNRPFTTANLVGLAPGDYYINVGDSFGCSARINFHLDSGSSALSAIHSVNNFPCIGSSYINVTGVGGVQPYSYQIDGGGYVSEIGFSGYFDHLLAGQHVVNVKDASGTVITLHDTLAPQNDHFITTATVTNASSINNADGTITLHLNGAIGPVNIDWTPLLGHSSSISGLRPGTHIANVSDSLGCGATYTFVVGSGSSTISGTAKVRNVSCYGDSTGSITIVGNGATQPLLYRIGNGPFQTNNVFSHLPAGTYMVTITDPTTAISVVSATISQPASPLTVTANHSNANGAAPTGSITISISGGTAPYTAAWSDATVHSMTRTPLYYGTYDLGVIDSAGCMAELTFNVDSTVLAKVSAHTDVACAGDSTGTIHVSATGGTAAYLYRLGNGSYQTDSVFTHLTPGTYTITVRAVGNDSSVVTQAIVSNHSPIVASGTVTNPSSTQQNGTITLNVSGGVQPYAYNWGGGVTTENRTGLASGNYTVTVTDSVGCHVSKTFTLQPSGISGTNADEFGLSIYPNPTSGMVNIHLEHTAGDVSISIYDVTGQLMMTKNYNASATANYTMDMEQLAVGMYQIKVVSGGRSSTAKLLVSR